MPKNFCKKISANSLQKTTKSFLKVCDRLKTPKMASGHYWMVQKNSTKKKICKNMNACESLSVYVCQKNRASYYYI